MALTGKTYAVLAAQKLRKTIKALEKAYFKSQKAINNDPVAKVKGDRSVLWSLDGKTPRRRVIKKNTLTLRELFKRSAASRIKTAARDRVTIIKLGVSKKNPNKLMSKSLTYGHVGRKMQVRKYDHVIIRLEPLKRFSDSKVMVSCSCEDFKFTFEYALAKRGNSQIIHSNGEASEIRNPRNIASGCKHLIVLFKKVLHDKM